MIRALVASALLVAVTAAAAEATPTGTGANKTTTVDANNAVGADRAELSKKERWLRDKSAAKPAPEVAARAHKVWQRKLARRLGKKPAPIVSVFNGWTHETLPFRVARTIEKIPQQVVNRFLRCRFTNRVTNMDARLLPNAVEAAKHFGSDRIVVISGFRSPKYNLILRKKGREVSRTSKHKLGKALDFRIDGVSAAQLRDWVKGLRLGGVGYYAGSGFVHMDTAAIRYWTGK